MGMKMGRTRLMPSTESITYRATFTETSFHPLKHIIYLFITTPPPHSLAPFSFEACQNNGSGVEF